MSCRLLTVALLASSIAFAAQSYAGTVIKSGKSNGSDRMSGGGGGKALPE